MFSCVMFGLPPLSGFNQIPYGAMITGQGRFAARRSVLSVFLTSNKCSPTRIILYNSRLRVN